ncbi:MAG TPA: SDR family NAD(P)-dependent oxidoreductase [Nitrososphaeraceae archaeon]|nr:SDR family NAD(P)-dependent oxidoreductase [Nitrososphaeraceae archaeon]
MKFKDQIIAITGASSGIGKQAALDFSYNGAKTVILISRNNMKLNQVKKELNPDCNVEVYTCDISNKKMVYDVGQNIIERIGAIDILVNNAGIGIYGKVIDQTIEDMEKVTSTNYLGMIYFTKTFLPSMIKNKRGHIVNVASLAASFGIPCMAAYCGSKFAMLGFSESLSYELKNTNVGVTVVSPIAVKTNFFDNESFKGKMPHKLGYVLDPKTVSKAILTAAYSKRIEIVVPFFVRSAIWLKHTFPYLIKPIVSSSFKDQDYK